MKNLRTSLLCACIALAGFGASAQTEPVPLNEPNMSKPKLFNALPETIPVSVAVLEDLLHYQTGNTVNLVVSTSFQFRGQVVSAASKYGDTMQSIVIRSSNYNGARLAFTKTTNPDGSIIYSGR